MNNWWITQVPQTQCCFQRRLQVKGEMSSWGNGRLPGTERGTQDGASADEGNVELAQVGLPVCPYVCPALSRSAAVPWHNDPGTVLSIPLLPCAPENSLSLRQQSQPHPCRAGPVLSCVPGGGRKAGEEKGRKKRKGAKDHLCLSTCSDAIPNFHK